MFIIRSKTITVTINDIFIPTKHNQNNHSFKNFKISLRLINISNLHFSNLPGHGRLGM